MPTGRLLLGDEISPDTCRLWDRTIQDEAQRVMDKDRFRQDLGQVEGRLSTGARTGSGSILQELTSPMR